MRGGVGGFIDAARWAFREWQANLQVACMAAAFEYMSNELIKSARRVFDILERLTRENPAADKASSRRALAGVVARDGIEAFEDARVPLLDPRARFLVREDEKFRSKALKPSLPSSIPNAARSRFGGRHG
jgi:hypothetical protein